MTRSLNTEYRRADDPLNPKAYKLPSLGVTLERYLTIACDGFNRTTQSRGRTAPKLPNPELCYALSKLARYANDRKIGGKQTSDYPWTLGPKNLIWNYEPRTFTPRYNDLISLMIIYFNNCYYWMESFDFSGFRLCIIEDILPSGIEVDLVIGIWYWSVEWFAMVELWCWFNGSIPW